MKVKPGFIMDRGKADRDLLSDSKLKKIIVFLAFTLRIKPWQCKKY